MLPEGERFDATHTHTLPAELWRPLLRPVSCDGDTCARIRITISCGLVPYLYINSTYDRRDWLTVPSSNIFLSLIKQTVAQKGQIIYTLIQKSLGHPYEVHLAGHTVYVYGYGVTEEILRNQFTPFGPIVNISMEVEKNCGFITYEKVTWLHIILFGISILTSLRTCKFISTIMHFYSYNIPIIQYIRNKAQRWFSTKVICKIFKKNLVLYRTTPVFEEYRRRH